MKGPFGGYSRTGAMRIAVHPTKTSSLESTATPNGSLSPEAIVVMVPVGVTFLIAPFPLSATNTFPLESTATPRGNRKPEPIAIGRMDPATRTGEPTAFAVCALGIDVPDEQPATANVAPSKKNRMRFIAHPSLSDSANSPPSGWFLWRTDYA